MSETKLSNPKEAFGDAKMPMDLCPDTALAQFNLAFLEGALKYGQYNWRIAGVKVSTYVRAARRHLAKFWNGQDRDPVTLVHELASVGACCAILLDAIACGKLNDDRPPRADMEKVLKDAAEVAAHLKQLFKDHSPPQYTEREHGPDPWRTQTVEFNLPGHKPTRLGMDIAIGPDTIIRPPRVCVVAGCNRFALPLGSRCKDHT